MRWLSSPFAYNSYWNSSCHYDTAPISSLRRFVCSALFCTFAAASPSVSRAKSFPMSSASCDTWASIWPRISLFFKSCVDKFRTLLLARAISFYWDWYFPLSRFIRSICRRPSSTRSSRDTICCCSWLRYSAAPSVSTTSRSIVLCFCLCSSSLFRMALAFVYFSLISLNLNLYWHSVCLCLLIWFL